MLCSTKRGGNAGVALTSFYFGVKSIYFILEIIEAGKGFSWVRYLSYTHSNAY